MAGELGVCGPNGIVDLLDILAVLNGFQGDFADGCELVNMDIAGAEGKLTHPRDMIGYFKALAKASPRVKLLEMGGTEEGRIMHLVAISNEDTLRNLDRYKGYTARLADPRKTDEAEALSSFE